MFPRNAPTRSVTKTTAPEYHTRALWRVRGQGTVSIYTDEEAVRDMTIALLVVARRGSLGGFLGYPSISFFHQLILLFLLLFQLLVLLFLLV
jgi:hypothetical protein